MMHFPSWESFATTVESLEYKIETHDDSFLVPNQHLSEDDLNDLEESMGHEPDLPLIEYELTHSFCSLRQVEAAAENAWLDASDQPGWTMNDWQENQFLADPVQQTLYNPYNEVMICNVIYKDMEGGMLMIDINHPDAVDALTAANNGTSLEEIIATYGGDKEVSGAASVKWIDPNACFYESSKSIGIQLDNTYGMRASHQIRERIFDNSYNDVNVFKAFTKNYKKKGRKMKKRRISSSARIFGDLYSIDERPTANPLDNCNYLKPTNKQGDYRKKRRSKVKARETHVPNLITGTSLDELESEHRQRPFYNNITFEN
jgi:hypothetical protein